MRIGGQRGSKTGDGAAIHFDHRSGGQGGSGREAATAIHVDHLIGRHAPRLTVESDGRAVLVTDRMGERRFRLKPAELRPLLGELGGLVDRYYAP